MQNRIEVRKNVRHARRQLPPQAQLSHALLATELLINQPLYKKAQHIALYLAVDGEINPMPLMEKALSQGKHTYLPVMHPMKEHHILFMPYEPGDKLITNCFGILEPSFDENKIMFPWLLNLVMTPLVAFDDAGNRLGVGAGCYDRTFSFLRLSHTPHPPVLIGMAHECQRLPFIEHEPWDIPLHGILTEKSFRLIP